MKKLAILVVLGFINFCQSQSIKKDWVSFSIDKWETKIELKTESLFSKKTLGEISFVSTEDNSKKVRFYILHKSEIDSSFTKSLKIHYIAQSCLYEKGKYELKSFYFNDYFYMFKACPSCSTKLDLDCENLAKNINNFVGLR